MEKGKLELTDALLIGLIPMIIAVMLIAAWFKQSLQPAAFQEGRISVIKKAVDFGVAEWKFNARGEPSAFLKRNSVYGQVEKDL